ncbi:MAG: hypothetical protein O3C25_01140 [Chloroflexi bacterium]|nr:hypothetical protein [Chloroflexota bacterium]
MRTDDVRTREELERCARQSGLVNLTPGQMEELRQADAYARVLLAKLPRDFALTDEPPHVFHAGDHA